MCRHILSFKRPRIECQNLLPRKHYTADSGCQQLLLPDESASRRGKTCIWTEVFWQPADEPFW